MTERQNRMLYTDSLTIGRQLDPARLLSLLFGQKGIVAMSQLSSCSQPWKYRKDWINEGGHCLLYILAPIECGLQPTDSLDVLELLPPSNSLDALPEPIRTSPPCKIWIRRLGLLGANFRDLHNWGLNQPRAEGKFAKCLVSLVRRDSIRLCYLFINHFWLGEIALIKKSNVRLFLYIYR